MKRFGLVAGLLMFVGAEVRADPEVMMAGFKVERMEIGERLREPTGLLWLDGETLLVLEKSTGKVRVVRKGKLTGEAAYAFAVNFKSERGLLGIAAHPKFAVNHWLYVYYTQASRPRNDGRSDEFIANRVTRFAWNEKTMRLEEPREIFNFPYNPRESNGPNHDGGKIVFGPDGKLYGVIGDQNRRGLEQNERGSEKDKPRTVGSGIIFRLNDDGTIPKDNPWAGHQDPNIQRAYAVGVRNSFGLAFDPVTGMLWDTENGDQDFDEINRVPAKFNSGWTYVMGPIWHERNKGKDREKLLAGETLGAEYHDPVFSWLSCRGLTCCEFLNTEAYGAAHKNAFLCSEINGGCLFYFTLNAERDRFVVKSEGLKDFLVPGQSAKEVERAEEEIILAKKMGGITDIQLGFDGLAYMASYQDECIYVLKPAGK